MLKIAAAGFVWAGLLGATSPALVPYAKLLHVRVAMRDNIRLDTNVFLPPGSGRFPTVLIRTPYGKGPDLPVSYRSFINHGYTVVMQDVRGRYGSAGGFNVLNQEGPDGYDTLNWIAAQPWSDGKVGMIGGSYLGIAQWRVALLNNPHLKAIFPVVSGSDDYFDRYYSEGGAMKLGHRLLWMSLNLTPPGTAKPKFGDYIYHLPLRSVDRSATRRTQGFYQTILNHPTYDSFWKNLSIRENIERVHVPVFSVGGWYDNFAESDLEAFSALHKLDGRLDDRHRIMIGPWAHNMSTPFPGVTYGDDSSSPIRSYQIAWFDHWLKGAPEDAHRFSPEKWHAVRSEVDEAPVHIFVMGVNRWRDEPDWPLERARHGGAVFGERRRGQQFVGRRRFAVEAGAGQDAGGHRFLYLRPAQSGADARRRGVLRSEGFPLGAHRPAACGEAQRRAGVYQRSDEAGSGSHRADSRGAIRVHLGSRYRLYGQAGGRVSER